MNKFNNKKIFKSGISLLRKELISQLLILKNPGIFRNFNINENEQFEFHCELKRDRLSYV